MDTLFWLLVFAGGGIALAYRRVSLETATLVTALALFVYTALGDSSGWFKLFWWVVFLAIAIPLNVPAIRRERFTRPVLELYRRIMPEMSDTEREALEAGTVWWDGDLFAGDPDWKKLLATPVPSLSAEERAFLDGPVEQLCGMLDEWRITHELADLPPEVWDFLKKNGFFAMIIPKKYGGLEFSALAHSEVLIKIASRSPTCASIVAVPNSLGPAELLLKYGTEEQKDHYLPRLARGEDIPCFALTSPRAGSDAGAIPDIGIVCRGTYAGREVVGIRLDFDKRYITLAPVATVIGLAFKLYDPDNLLGEGIEDYGITCALIPRDTPGLEIGRRHFPLNVPFQNGPVRGKGVFVPIDFIIGGPKMAGQGWKMLVECLSAGRSISLPSNTTGGAKLAVYATGAYARIRKQFHMPIGRFEGVEEVLARMGGYLYAMDATRIMTVGAVDQGEVPSVPSAIAKHHVTEMARQVANDAMDVHGGKGIMLGPRNYLGRGYQSVPIAITVEGANILTRSMIIFGQGAIRCHPYVLKEMRAAQLEDPQQALEEFDDALFGHIGYALSNAARAFVLAATHARYTHVPVSGPTRRYFQHIERYSAAFALAADACMLTMGGHLKQREKISARLGDMLSYLYIASAVLKRYEDTGRPVEDLPLVHWACRHCIYRLQEQLHSLLRNLPNRWVAAVLRFLVFPTGRRYSAPSDEVGKQVAELLINPTAARARLVAGIHTGDRGGPIGLMEEALALAVQAEPVERRIRKAQKEGRLPRDERIDLRQAALAAGLIDRTEHDLLKRLDELAMEIIRVDDFAHEELGTKPLAAG
ncbi:MAG TPA: acyl-CoA dehydrogenase [Gammaproteobacteria bacterium]|nr:acyl-CoA dehydrogenase [Gammaproteobacteria bacterium]